MSCCPLATARLISAPPGSLPGEQGFHTCSPAASSRWLWARAKAGLLFLLKTVTLAFDVASFEDYGALQVDTLTVAVGNSSPAGEIARQFWRSRGLRARGFMPKKILFIARPARDRCAGVAKVPPSPGSLIASVQSMRCSTLPATSPLPTPARRPLRLALAGNVRRSLARAARLRQSPGPVL